MPAEQDTEIQSLREAAALCSSARDKHVHVGAALMPDYLDTYYNPFSSVLQRGWLRRAQQYQ